MKKLIILGLLLFSACSQAVPITPSAAPAQTTPTAAATAVLTAIPPTIAPTATASPTALPSATLTATATASAMPTITQTPTIQPTYAVLRGTVMVGQAVCHYGPGQPYLYKYGVIQGNRLEILRRVEPGAYVEVRAIGGDNPCWLNPEYLDITGDLQSVQPVAPEDVKIPFSPYYPNPVAGVSATRSGSQVSIAWTPYVLKAGDDSEQYPYLIEAWVCREGEIEFEPKGFWQPFGQIEDQPGCAEPSHARLYAVDKHGYTPWIEIPWPPAE
ncbi:MAG TPA: hypothetical protein VIO36_15795 [Anaerolineaceae bacterium]